MTGYGRGMAEQGGRRAIVEIRSVNHRFLDLKLRGASIEPALEERVTGAVRAVCQRGSVTVSIRLERHGALAALGVDIEAARRVHAQLVALARALGMDESLSLGLLCAQPGVLVPPEDAPQGGPQGGPLGGPQGGIDDDVVSACVSQALGQALDVLVHMRETEGKALTADLDARLSRISELVDEIAAASAEAADEGFRRLRERVGRLLKKAQVDIDESRLAQELAFMADRLDVTEELVRLRSHLEQVRLVMVDSASVGRRLDFLVQEMGRELNTVASKSQSAAIARVVVEAKAELEKIREQVQNIE